MFWHPMCTEIINGQLVMYIAKFISISNFGVSTKPGPWTGLWTGPWTGLWTGPWTVKKQWNLDKQQGLN